MVYKTMCLQSLNSYTYGVQVVLPVAKTTLIIL